MSSAGSGVVAWEGCTTSIPQGFATLCLETNGLHCKFDRGLALTGTEAQTCCTADAVHLLCRALRLAPKSYRHLELEADHPRARLTLTGDVLMPRDDDEPDPAFHVESIYHSVAELAAAMQQFAAAEGLSVHVSPDECSIIVSRVGDQLHGSLADAQ